MQSGLQINRLAQKLKEAWISEMENEDGSDFLEKMSVKMATAIIDEVKEMKVLVPSGIKVSTTGNATSQTGATTENKLAELS